MIPAGSATSSSQDLSGFNSIWTEHTQGRPFFQPPFQRQPPGPSSSKPSALGTGQQRFLPLTPKCPPATSSQIPQNYATEAQATVNSHDNRPQRAPCTHLSRGSYFRRHELVEKRDATPAGSALSSSRCVVHPRSGKTRDAKEATVSQEKTQTLENLHTPCSGRGDSHLLISGPGSHYPEVRGKLTEKLGTTWVAPPAGRPPGRARGVPLPGKGLLERLALNTARSLGSPVAFEEPLCHARCQASA